MNQILPIKDAVPSTVSLSNGVELHYLRSGRGTPLIFIHGAMGDYRSWQPQWSVFAERFACITYSRRYSYPNRNTMPSPDHSALVDAEDLILFMKALGIEKAILVGSSYGGFTAIAAAVRNPKMFMAVVAVEPPMMRYAHMNEDGARIAEAFLAATALPAREAFERGDDIAGVRILTEGIVARMQQEGGENTNAPAIVNIESRLENAVAARMLSLSSDEFPLLAPESLATLGMPVLLMSGERTAPIHAAIFNQVVRHMPQARALTVKDSGHSVSREQPARFNAAVLAFLEPFVVPVA